MSISPSSLDPAALMLALDQSFNAVVMTDAHEGKDGNNIVYVNAAFCRMTGYNASELLGRNPRMLQGPATNPDVIERLRECLQEGTYFHGSTINYRKDGRPYTVEWNISPVRNVAGEITNFISVQQDISGLMASQKAAQLFAHVLNATDDGVLITDNEGVIEFSNKGFEKITGYRLTEVLGRKPSMLKSSEQVDSYQSMLDALKQGRTFRSTYAIRVKNGQQVHCDEAITPLTNEEGQVTHYVSIFRDLTTRVLEEQMFREMTRFDSLTGALTRASGELALEKAYMQARGSKLPMAIAVVDIDHFKRVNDSFGHSSGDTVLKAVSRGLIATLRANDNVVRWGGEEFLLIFSGCELEQAAPLAERCCATVRKIVHDRVGQVTISVGVGELHAGESLAALIERVDRALYRAKHAGRNRVEICA